jgi:hypothetical protein
VLADADVVVVVSCILLHQYNSAVTAVTLNVERDHILEDLPALMADNYGL